MAHFNLYKSFTMLVCIQLTIVTNFPIQNLTECYRLSLYLKNILYIRSKCDSLRNELEHKNTYIKVLEETLKLKDQGDNVTDQTQAQEQIMMITEMTDKKNDEDISEVSFKHLVISVHLAIH